jgi:hypothetical protein
VLLIAGLMLIVRPMSVCLSTVGTGLTWREKAYLSLIAPRGIVAAAMASYFASHFRGHDPAAANQIESLVFLTIAATVCIQGGWAGPLAWLLGVTAARPRGLLLVGVNEWSLALAEELRSRGEPVRFLDSNPVKCEAARARDFVVDQVDATEARTFEQIDLSSVGQLLALTPNDAINTLACDAASPWLGAENVLQVLSKPVSDPGRSRVRMSGRWALPTGLSHQQVTQLLQEGRLQLAAEPCKRPLPINHPLGTLDRPIVPLVIVDGKGCRIAVEAETCAAGCTLIALVRSPGSGVENAGEEEIVASPPADLPRSADGKRGPDGPVGGDG